VLDAHGADAVRWYFLSQVQPWTNMRFSMERVGDSKKDFLIRLGNVWSFFNIYARIDRFDPTEDNLEATSADASALSQAKTYVPVGERSLMDRWIVSELHLTVRNVTKALDAYDILGASTGLFDFVEHLSNWYVRGSRSRFWASGMGRDKLCAYWTLYECLATLSRLAAPFVPFFSEDLYRNLVAQVWEEARRLREGPPEDRSEGQPTGQPTGQPESVHLTAYPEAQEELIELDLARRMGVVLEVVTLGRAARVDAGLRVRQPLHEAVLVVADRSLEASLGDLLPLVKDELNVKEVRFAADADQYVVYQMKPNFKRIGPRLGPLVQELKSVLAAADCGALRGALESTGKCEVLVKGTPLELTADDLEIGLQQRDGYTARAGKGVVLVLETRIDDALTEEWWAREVVAASNGLRGDRSLPYEARILLTVWSSPRLQAALTKHAAYVKGETLASDLAFRPLDEPGGATEGSAGAESFRVDLEVA
jgi:isoleucyl-tRNA synthetase